MPQDTFPIPEALVQVAPEVAQAEQTALDDFVGAAMTDKSAAARPAQYVHPRVARADPPACLAVLARLQQGAGPVVEGDELEPGRGARSSRCHDTYKRVL